MSARTVTPRAAIGATLLRMILGGETRDAKLEAADAPISPLHRYEEGAEVWLWLPAPSPAMRNPLTGEAGVWAEAVVIGHEPMRGVPLGERVVVVTRRMWLKGPVLTSQLRPRKPGEISPGRVKFGPGKVAR